MYKAARSRDRASLSVNGCLLPAKFPHIPISVDPNMVSPFAIYGKGVPLESAVRESV